MESTLSFLCFCSDPPLSRQGATLAHLDFLPPYDLVLWIVPFSFGKDSLAYLPIALSAALRPLFLFQQAQYAKVFLLKPMAFCKLFTGLGSTNKSAISLLFSSYLTHVLSSSFSSLLRLPFYFKLSGRSGRNYLLSSSVLSGYNESPDIGFSRGITQLMSWPDGERFLRPQQSLVVLSSYLSYPLLSFLGLEAYHLIEVL